MRLKKIIPGKLENCWVLFGIVLVLNITQSVFTPLLNDESYYWLYAKYPDWGYFDHPPLIAFLIRAGNTIFSGEIGVRLLSCIFGSLTFLVIYKIIEFEAGKPVSFKLVGLLMLSSLFLNLYSFLAIPDTPMLFFAALFLYAYRRYLNTDNFFNTLVLGAVIALLLYSKYHGILLIVFTVLSNIRLVFKKSFYILLVVAVLLYIPHIYWQIQNDYPTIRFQFLQRASVFKLQHVLSYIGEQAGVTGPIVFLLFSVLYKPKNQFQKTLKYNVIGTFIFFLISSFKETVNVHWTAIAWPSMLCLSYLYIRELKANKKLVTGILAVNLIVVVILRINLISNTYPIANFNDKNPRLMTSLLKAGTNGYPLVFRDMYIEPSCFWFYTHKECFAVNDIWFKKTQYNYLSGLEKKFQGKTVSLVSKEPINNSSKKTVVEKGKIYFTTVVPNFTSYSTSVKVTVLNGTDFYSSTKSSIKLSLKNTLTNQEKNLFKLKGTYLLLTFINSRSKQIINYRYNKSLNILDPMTFNFQFQAPVQKGKYTFVFSMVTDSSYVVGFNSNVYNCNIL